MNKTSVYLLAATATLLAGAGIGAAVHAQNQTAAAASSPGTAQPSALVRTQVLQLRSMHASITAYGDILPGRTQAISSAAPAQIVRLNVMAGQSVRKGQVLAVLEGDPGVQLAYTQAQTAHTLAQAELARMKSMAGLQLATQSQVETAQKAAADAQAAVLAQQALGGAHGGQSVTAPEDGVVLMLNSFQGDRVQPGVPFMQIGATRELKLVLGVEPAALSAVRNGMRVSVSALGAGTAPGQTAAAVTGTVVDIQNMLDPKTQLANVVVKLPATAAFLPGTRVRAEIALAAQSAYAVPRQAVLSDAAGSYVFQIAQQRAQRVAVQQLMQIDSNTLGIASVNSADGVPGGQHSLDPALPLVVLGNYELSDGMAVREAQ